MRNDPREYRCASAGFLLAVLRAQIRSFRIIQEIAIPTLFLLAGNDFLVDVTASRRLFLALRVEDKQEIEYPDMYHALSIDLGKEKVFQDIEDWVKRA